METKRQEKFARLIQKDLGEIFQSLGRDLFSGSFITVSGVKVSPDLGVVKVYLSIFQAKDKQETLEEIRGHGREIRKQLAARLRHQVRKIPELEFFADESLDYAQHMDELFRKLKLDEKPGPDKE